MSNPNAPWTPPSDFAAWIVIERLADLSARYGVAQSTILGAIKRLPAGVQEARNKAILERKLVASRMGYAAKLKVDAARVKSPVGVSKYRDPVDVSDRAIRNATQAFEAHYCDVADRNPQWPILGYAA